MKAGVNTTLRRKQQNIKMLIIEIEKYLSKA